LSGNFGRQPVGGEISEFFVLLFDKDKLTGGCFEGNTPVLLPIKVFNSLIFEIKCF
jgi:hypothetical protein